MDGREREHCRENLQTEKQKTNRTEMNEQPNQNTETALEKPPSKTPVAIGQRGIQITDMDGLWRFAVAVSKSGLAPKGIQSPEAIFVALEMGLEVGLPPMAALQNIAVINGRPSIWGDAMLAVCRGTGEVELFEEWYEDAGKRLPRNPVAFTDTTVAVCKVKRDGYAAQETGFSVQDAKTAKLWGKEGPWTQYPARMLRFRARSFALRDTFGDALKGLRSAEEVSDDPIELAKPAAPAGFVPRVKDAEKKSKVTVAPVTEVEAEKVTQLPTNESPSSPRDIPHSHHDDKLPDDPTQEIGKLQAQFRDFCETSRVAWEDCRDWMKTTGWYSQSDACESWADIPGAVLEALAKNPNAMGNLVKIHGKAAK